MRRLARPVLLMWLLASAACIVAVRRGSIEEILPGEVDSSRRVLSPMKAFLVDGSTVVYEHGGLVTPDSIAGVGMRYTPGMTDTLRVEQMPLDSVVGIEAFQGGFNGGASLLATLGASALAILGGSLLAVAIFGSCPTIYASPEQGGLLQSEAFSYSIAPLLEGRDLDALRVRPDADGVIRLELRNEALETHYINELQLVAVDHPADVRAIPDDQGLPIGIVGGEAPTGALDRDGTVVLAPLSADDGVTFASSPDRIRATSEIDDRDYIELNFDRPAGDEAVLTLRLRNSLLTTILFYDLMLDRAGAGAIDWIGRDLARIGSVVELGKWFQDAMGLRVQVPDGDDWKTVGRVPDTGPIAWEEIGVRVPVPESGPVRVRLSFFTDAWRIDRVALALPGELSRVTRMAPDRILQDGRPAEGSVLEDITRPDDRYVATHPGATAMLEFVPPEPAPAAAMGRSYLLSTQGYYTEWVRSEWIRSPGDAVTFEPGEDTVEALMRIWIDKKDAFEADFFASRIPVR